MKGELTQMQLDAMEREAESDFQDTLKALWVEYNKKCEAAGEQYDERIVAINELRMQQVAPQGD